MGSHSLFQGIFPTQGSNPGLPSCGQNLYHLSHQGSTYGFILQLNKCFRIHGLSEAPGTLASQVQGAAVIGQDGQVKQSEL